MVANKEGGFWERCEIAFHNLSCWRKWGNNKKTKQKTKKTKKQI